MVIKLKISCNDYRDLIRELGRLEAENRKYELERERLEKALANEGKNAQSKIDNAVEIYQEEVDALTKNVKKMNEEIEELKKIAEKL